jgi:hypothetical protein
LKNFKETVRILNSNAKPAKKIDPLVFKAERLKYEQNKRASQKRGIQRWDVETA